MQTRSYARLKESWLDYLEFPVSFAQGGASAKLSNQCFLGMLLGQLRLAALGVKVKRRTRQDGKPPRGSKAFSQGSAAAKHLRCSLAQCPVALSCRVRLQIATQRLLHKRIMPQYEAQLRDVLLQRAPDDIDPSHPANRNLGSPD